MVISVAYENGEVSQHFGNCEQYKIFEVWDGVIADSAIVTAIGSGHDQRATFLNDYNTDVLICGGIGEGARDALSSSGIKIYAGVRGDADSAVSSFLSGSLKYDPEASCSHHKHGSGGCCSGHDNGESHSCGCGNHGHSNEGHSCGC